MVSSRASLASAWAVILTCIGFSLVPALFPVGADPEDVASEVAAAEGEDGEWVGFREEVTARLVVAFEALETMTGGPGTVGAAAQVEPLAKSESAMDNIVAAALFARLKDFDRAQALAALAVSHAEADPSKYGPPTLDLAKRVQRLVDGLSTENAGNLQVDEADREVIEKRLGWVGQLLCSTAKPNAEFERTLDAMPIRIGIAFAAVLMVAGIGGLAGAVVLVLMLVRASQRNLTLTLGKVGSIGAGLPWIFAIWFASMIVVSLLAGLLVDRSDRLGFVGGTMLQVVVMLLPLVALLVPTLHGRAWSEIRREIGLHSGAGVLREIGYGFVTYATAIPLVVAGAIIATVASALAGGGIETASHPIQDALSEGGTGQRVMLFLIAAVFAPFVEEIVFRGVLYRHLRELTLKWGAPVSIMTSALSSSFIFAAIHPQGVFFIPVLGALACAFCLARETRGSLIAPMVAHGINNGLVLSLGLAISA